MEYFVHQRNSKFRMDNVLYTLFAQHFQILFHITYEYKLKITYHKQDESNWTINDRTVARTEEQNITA